MAQTTFSEPELMADCDYARGHVVAGHRLHGGFDRDGRYIPPRSRFRPQAIEGWTAALRARGGELLAADASLLAGRRYPTVEQSIIWFGRRLAYIVWYH